jgi:hypothetical protein
VARPRGVSSDNGVRPRPRCGKPLEVRRLAARVRVYDFGFTRPSCGLPEGHEAYVNCLSEETVEQLRRRRREKTLEP